MSSFENSSLTEIPFKCSGHIYRSAIPDESQVSKWHEFGIKKVVVLLTDRERTMRDIDNLYKKYHIDQINFPIQDFSVPEDKRKLKDLVCSILKSAKAGENILIHCMGGKGRTGIILAALAEKRYSKKYSSEEIINWVREYVPGAVETKGQEKFLADFKEYLLKK